MAKSVSLTSFSYEMMTKMLAPLTKEMIVEQMDLAYGGFLIGKFSTLRKAFKAVCIIPVCKTPGTANAAPGVFC